MCLAFVGKITGQKNVNNALHFRVPHVFVFFYVLPLYLTHGEETEKCSKNLEVRVCVRVCLWRACTSTIVKM